VAPDLPHRELASSCADSELSRLLPEVVLRAVPELASSRREIAPSNGAIALESIPSIRVTFDLAQNLPNDQLASRITQLNRAKCVFEADLLIYLGEFDHRKLYREYACESLFKYLMLRLGQTEDVAYKWKWGARLTRDFPAIHEFISTGKLSLSALLLLKPYLTQENHLEWLTAAAGKSKREVEKLIATRYPQPDAPSRIRKLPSPANYPHEPGTTATTHAPSPNTILQNEPPNPTNCPREPGTTATTHAPSPGTVRQERRPAFTHDQPNRNAAALTRPSRAPKLQPLSECSYRVVFTACERLKQKLERARGLLSHAIPPTDLPALFERALDSLIEREERRRFGSPRTHASSRESIPASDAGLSAPTSTSPEDRAPTSISPEDRAPTSISPEDRAPTSTSPEDRAPTSTSPVTRSKIQQKATAHSRYIPVEVRREVWRRDTGQCTYVDAEGRRCQCRDFLQLDHRQPHAAGGTATVENIRMRCAAHNALAAEQVYGRERVADSIALSRQKRRHPCDEHERLDPPHAAVAQLDVAPVLAEI
jgi:hypothetical protein